jgi:hypothetical protein
LNEKVAAPVKKAELTTRGIRCADHATPSTRQKLALTSPTSGGRSAGIVRLRTKGHKVLVFFFFFFFFREESQVHMSVQMGYSVSGDSMVAHSVDANARLVP